MEPKQIPLSELQAYPLNPKQHDLGAIHTSINQFGYLDRIVINKTTGHILSGHGRVETLTQQHAQQQDAPAGIQAQNGEWLVPVDFVDVPKAQEGAAVVALNRTVELGGWDNEALAILLQDIANQDEKLLDATGYDGGDLDHLLKSLEGYPDGVWDSEEHWVGLPEFEPGEPVSTLQIIVHFEAEEDLKKFGEILNLSLTEKTKATWWPPKRQRDLASIRFEDGNTS